MGSRKGQVESESQEMGRGQGAEHEACYSMIRPMTSSKATKHENKTIASFSQRRMHPGRKLAGLAMGSMSVALG